MKNTRKHSLTRLISLLISALLVLVSLAGCGGNANNSSGDAGTPNSGKTSSAGEAGEPSDTGETGGNTLSAIICMSEQGKLEPNEFPSIQEIEASTGVHVEWEIYRSVDSWNERKALVLAGGDLPDMFFGNHTLLATDVVSNKDLFTDLAPLLDKLPNVAKMFEEEPGIKNVATLEDGSVMFLPSRMPLRPKTLTNVFINKSWLDTLGLSMPTTTDELVTVLEAFRDKDPNGNGQQDEIPMMGNGAGYNNNALLALLGAFGVTYNEFSDNEELLMIKENALHFVPTMEQYKECLIYLNELFEKGLIDPESFTQDGSQYSAKNYASDPQVVGVASAWTVSSGVGEANKDSYVTLPPLKGPHGDQLWSSNPLTLSTTQFSWALSDSCQDKDAALKYVNEFYDPEIGVQFYFGSYGVSLEKQDDGKVKVLESGDPEVTFDSWLWMNGFGDRGPYYISKEFDKKLIPNSWAEEKVNIDAIYTPYIPSEDEIYPMMFYSSEDNAELSVLRTDIRNIVDQKLAQWVTGEADINAEWNDYLASLENVGLSRAMEIYNKYWEASKG